MAVNSTTKRILAYLSPIFLLFLLCMFYVYRHTIDDAFISLRYAENLVNYGRLSFNHGELPQEGYTNFLLVLIEAFFLLLGLGDNVIHVAKIIGIISGLITIFYTYLLTAFILKEKEDGAPVPAFFYFIPSLAVAVSTPFIIWSGAGLETVLFTSLAAAAIFHYFKFVYDTNLKSGYLSEGLFFLSVLCRPEGLMFWGLTYLYSLVFIKKFSFINKIKAGLPFVILFIGYLLWKQSYFGDILPLTYYAKDFGPVWERIVGGLKRFTFYLRINLTFVYVLLFLLSLFFSVFRKNFKLLFINFLTLLYVIYVVRLGPNIAMDDCFRMYVPYIPFFYIGAWAGLYYLIQRLAKINPRFLGAGLYLFVILQIAVGLYDLNTTWNKDMNFGSRIRPVGFNKLTKAWDDCYTDFAIWLRKNSPPGTTIVVADIGRLGYYSKLRIIDSWSLVTKEIVMIQNKQGPYPHGTAVHELFDKEARDYIFDQNPDIIFNDDHLGLFDDKRIANYTPINFKEVRFFEDEHLVYFRTDLLEEFKLKEVVGKKVSLTEVGEPIK